MSSRSPSLVQILLTWHGSRQPPFLPPPLQNLRKCINAKDFCPKPLHCVYNLCVVNSCTCLQRVVPPTQTRCSVNPSRSRDFAAAARQSQTAQCCLKAQPVARRCRHSCHVQQALCQLLRQSFNRGHRTTRLLRVTSLQYAVKKLAHLVGHI